MTLHIQIRSRYKGPYIRNWQLFRYAIFCVTNNYIPSGYEIHNDSTSLGLLQGIRFIITYCVILTVLVTTIDAQWEGMGDVGSARYEPALLPSCLTIRVLSYSN